MEEYNTRHGGRYRKECPGRIRGNEVPQLNRRKLKSPRKFSVGNRLWAVVYKRDGMTKNFRRRKRLVEWVKFRNEH